MIARGKNASDLFPAVVKNVACKNIEVRQELCVHLTSTRGKKSSLPTHPNLFVKYLQVVLDLFELPEDFVKKNKNVVFGFFQPERIFDFLLIFCRLLSRCLISHGFFIWVRIIGFIYMARINSFRVPVSLADPAGEEVGLRLPGAVRRGAAGSGSALHLHLSARVKGV